jgi:Pyridoxal-dependent decarboxylase conserved domain
MKGGLPGAVDPLPELRRIADREGAWLHVDAAYGGGLLLSRQRRGVLAGVELTDSVAVDPHKWFFAPVDVGAVLVQAPPQLTRSFGMEPAYLADELDEAGERYQYFVHGFERGGRGLEWKLKCRWLQTSPRALPYAPVENVPELHAGLGETVRLFVREAAVSTALLDRTLRRAGALATVTLAPERATSRGSMD